MPNNSTAEKEQGQPSLVLVVDDDRATRMLLAQVAGNAGYRVVQASNGKEAIQLAGELLPDAIMLDIVMPDLSGIEVCRFLQSDKRTERVPVILLTASVGRASRLEGLQAGAMDFLTKPADDVELQCRLRNLIRLKQTQDALLLKNEQLEQRVEQRTAELAVALVEVEKAYGRLRDMTLESIYRLTWAAEYRDVNTAVHTRRIAHYVQAIAKALGWDDESSDRIFYASPMHDIGKIGIPDSILLKAGPLTEQEQRVMRTHSQIGGQLLSGSRSEVLQMAERIARTHHEVWDGTGYPDGLSGEQIPIEGRIVMICDVYDALRMERPYKPAFDHDKAIGIIQSMPERTGRHQFDPTLLEAFLDLGTQMQAIFQEHEQHRGLPSVADWLAGKD